MFCPNCGKEIDDNQKFCHFCGTKIEHEQEVEEEKDVSNTDQEETSPKDTISFSEKVKQTPLYIKILSAVVGIVIIAVGAIWLYNYQQDIKPFTYTRNPDGRMDYHGTYNPFSREIHISMTPADVIIEDWEVDIIRELNKEHDYALYFVDENQNKIPPEITYIGMDLIANKPVTANFVIYNAKLKDFIKIKNALIPENKNPGIMFRLFPNLIRGDKEVREKAILYYKNLIEEQQKAEQQRAEDEEIINDVNTYAFRNVGGEKAPIDFNPRRCLFKVGGVCFGHPFFVHGMDYQECKNIKDEYGIESCKESKDLFASTAYVCGGTRNMPTPDELVVLANDLYNMTFDNVREPDGCQGSWDYGACNHKRGIRINRDYLEYFREVYWDNLNFENQEEENRRKNLAIIVLSNQEIGKSIYAREFMSGESSLGTARRYNEIKVYDNPSGRIYVDDPAYSICVDRSQSTPINKKYPISVKTYNKEVENELF